MIGIVLGITIPLFYFFSALSIMRYIYIYGDMDDLDRPIASVLVSLAWPIMFPAYLTIQSAKRVRKQRKAEIMAEYYAENQRRREL